MKLQKTVIGDEQVNSFLEQKYGDSYVGVERIGGKMSGEKSQAFYINLKSERFVIRFHRMVNPDFQKDKIAFEKFASEDLPIPETIEIGEFNDYHYSITTACEGKTLDKLDKPTTIGILEKIFDAMTSIHQISPLGKGYGWWDPASLEAPSQNQDHMVDSVINRDLWKKLDKNVSFFNLAQIERLAVQLEKNRGFIPKDRALVHADFGYNNSLSDGEVITGIIDWGESIYGDPLYDLAWLCMWSDLPENASIDYKEGFSRYAEKRVLVYENFNERLYAYLLIMGISSLEIFAESDREDDYKWTIYCLEGNGVEC